MRETTEHPQGIPPVMDHQSKEDIFRRYCMVMIYIIPLSPNSDENEISLYIITT